MYVRPFANNTSDSIIKVYYISKRYIIGGGSSRVEETLIGTIDSTFKFSSDEIYSNTFFSDVDGFGTIKLVPSAGNWYITNVSLKPYKAIDYSIDSFAAKVPLRSFTANELYEIEAELYDGGGKLAYGDGSYTFETNKIFTPLRKRIFIDPMGIAAVSVVGGGGGGGEPVFIDGGGA
jgi:hypothetical protein